MIYQSNNTQCSLCYMLFLNTWTFKCTLFWNNWGRIAYYLLLWNWYIKYYQILKTQLIWNGWLLVQRIWFIYHYFLSHGTDLEEKHFTYSYEWLYKLTFNLYMYVLRSLLILHLALLAVFKLYFLTSLMYFNSEMLLPYYVQKFFYFLNII